MTTTGHLALFNQHLQKANRVVEWVYSDGVGYGMAGTGIEGAGAEQFKGTKTTPVWFVEVVVDGAFFGKGKGNTKKAARNEAAKEGLEKMGIFVW
jgi:ribonuclease-3